MANAGYRRRTAGAVDFGDTLGVDATTASFVGLSILLLSGVLSWEDVKSEKGAWDTLIWFAALLMMANQLKN